MKLARTLKKLATWFEYIEPEKWYFKTSSLNLNHVSELDFYYSFNTRDELKMQIFLTQTNGTNMTPSLKGFCFLLANSVGLIFICFITINGHVDFITLD